MERQVLLAAQNGLVGKDLTPAYRAVRSGAAFPGLVPRFKKKEDVESMTKSILKFKIQTLTGKSLDMIKDEMNYKPKDPNEPSVDVDTMRKLASALILLSNEELPESNGSGASTNGHGAMEEEEEEPVARAGKRRAGPPGGSRAMLGGTVVEEVEPKVARPGLSSRRSLGNVLTPASASQDKPADSSTLRRGRKSLAVLPSSQPPSSPAPSKSKRRSVSGSLAVTSCPSPAPAAREKEHLAVLAEEDQAPVVANPTPMMKEMLKKRQSARASSSKSKSPAKAAAKSPVKLTTRTDLIMANAKEKVVVKRSPSPEPRADFQGKDGAKGFLVAGQPMELRLTKLTRTLPLSAQFPGAHLTMVHTPAEWGSHEIFSITTQLKKLNKEAGLGSYVLLVGTGLQNVHMNLEALGRHTQHTQFVTFSRNDANKGEEMGKLRESCCYFIVAYFFPGCEQQKSVLPSKMVRDGFSTCFVTESTMDLEASVIQCFSEPGEWLLDLACGSRQLSVAALERGRCAVAVHAEAGPLEDLGNFMRTLSLHCDSTYRDKDGLVLALAE